MSKLSDDSFFLYSGFRKYVPKKKLADFDNAYLSRKNYSIKFMTELIIKNVNLKYYHKHPKNPEDGFLFNFFLFDFSQRNSKTTKAFKDFKETKSFLATNFMYGIAHLK